MEREAITQITGVEDEDILYVCYDNRVGKLLQHKQRKQARAIS